MQRKFIFSLVACLLFGFGHEVYAAEPSFNCPAIAASTSDNYAKGCNSPLSPLQSAICNYKPRVWTDNLWLLDSTVGVGYVRALRSAGVDTPQCKGLLKDHQEYEKKLQHCESNGDCVLKVMRDWAGTLFHYRDQLHPPLAEGALKRFIGSAHIKEEKRSVALLQRLEQGMDMYPLPQVGLPGGNVLIWGFQPHNAQVQSLVIVNRQGVVQLVGLADMVYLSMPKNAKEFSLIPDSKMAVFVRDPAVLAPNLPAIQSWTAASILGFNQLCPGKDQDRCHTALTYPLPIQAYKLPCKAGKGNAMNPHCAISLPAVKNTISPGLFWQ